MMGGGAGVDGAQRRGKGDKRTYRYQQVMGGRAGVQGHTEGRVTKGLTGINM